MRLVRVIRNPPEYSCSAILSVSEESWIGAMRAYFVQHGKCEVFIRSSYYSW